MKDLKHIKSFNEATENLNISDVSNSLFFRYWDKQPLVYLSVDENGDEQMSDDKPVRQNIIGNGYWYSDTIRKCPNGFIEKLTGLSISWVDEPLQYMIKDKQTITDEEDKMLKKMARDLRKNNDY
jgi:hypothetical protein